jgi:farnesyl diphosphate synthase
VRRRAARAFAFEILSDPATHFQIRSSESNWSHELARAKRACGHGRRANDGSWSAKVRSFDLHYDHASAAAQDGALLGAHFVSRRGRYWGACHQKAGAPLRAYARDIGLAFQIADDLLDVGGDAETAGKAAAQG